MDLKNFKHQTKVTVRFHEVDMLGVCNNAVYINYFEQSRLQYVKDLGLVPEKGMFSDGSLFFIVRNEINYLSHARFDDELIVFSLVSFLKNSSYGFEHLIQNSNTKEIIVDGLGVIVHVDPKTRKSTLLPEKFVTAVKAFEKDLVIVK
jgi:acyl-CoA thioester hydrolase